MISGSFGGVFGGAFRGHELVRNPRSVFALLPPPPSGTLGLLFLYIKPSIYYWVGIIVLLGMRRDQAPAKGPLSAGARNRRLTWSKEVLKF